MSDTTRSAIPALREGSPDRLSGRSDLSRKEHLHRGVSWRKADRLRQVSERRNPHSGGLDEYRVPDRRKRQGPNQCPCGRGGSRLRFTRHPLSRVLKFLLWEKEKRRSKRLQRT